MGPGPKGRPGAATLTEGILLLFLLAVPHPVPTTQPVNFFFSSLLPAEQTAKSPRRTYQVAPHVAPELQVEEYQVAPHKAQPELQVDEHQVAPHVAPKLQVEEYQAAPHVAPELQVEEYQAALHAAHTELQVDEHTVAIRF
jgi:hypothetical protein